MNKSEILNYISGICLLSGVIRILMYMMKGDKREWKGFERVIAKYLILIFIITLVLGLIFSFEIPTHLFSGEPDEGMH